MLQKITTSTSSLYLFSCIYAFESMQQSGDTIAITDAKTTVTLAGVNIYAKRKVIGTTTDNRGNLPLTTATGFNLLPWYFHVGLSNAGV